MTVLGLKISCGGPAIIPTKHSIELSLVVVYAYSLLKLWVDFIENIING